MVTQTRTSHADSFYDAFTVLFFWNLDINHHHTFYGNKEPDEENEMMLGKMFFFTVDVGQSQCYICGAEVCL